MEKGNPGIIVDREALKQAAEYCKADLESAVVGEKEFAHLQGEMGFHYALAEKLPAITALAIRSTTAHRAAGDPPAATTEGRIVALADKLDHLAALASIGKLPKGGDDPFGTAPCRGGRHNQRAGLERGGDFSQEATFRAYNGFEHPLYRGKDTRR